MDSGELLRCHHLTIVRDDRTLWHDLSFKVLAGDLWLITGRNGSGKTTLLKTLAGLRPGIIDYIAPFSYLGHQDGLYPEHASHLSSGQRRQLALKRVFLSGRKLWILDEPLRNLDQKSDGAFWRKINDHRQSGGAVMMTHHGSLPHTSFKQLDAHET